MRGGERKRKREKERKKKRKKERQKERKRERKKDFTSYDLKRRGSQCCGYQKIHRFNELSTIVASIEINKDRRAGQRLKTLPTVGLCLL